MRPYAEFTSVGNAGKRINDNWGVRRTVRQSLARSSSSGAARYRQRRENVGSAGSDAVRLERAERQQHCVDFRWYHSRNSSQVIRSISRGLGCVWFVRSGSEKVTALLKGKIVTAAAQQKIFVVRTVVGDANPRVRIQCRFESPFRCTNSSPNVISQSLRVIPFQQDLLPLQPAFWMRIGLAEMFSIASCEASMCMPVLSTGHRNSARSENEFTSDRRMAARESADASAGTHVDKIPFWFRCALVNA